MGAGVNADGRHGEWRYVVVHNMNEIPALLADVVRAAAEAVA